MINLAELRAVCAWCQSPFEEGEGGFWVCPTHKAEQYANGIKVIEQDENGEDIEQWIYVPLPKQIEFHRSTAANLLFGGAAGGTKSHAMRWDAYMRCLRLPGYSVLLLRRNFPDLERTHIREAEKEQGSIGGRLIKNDKVMYFRNGSLTEFGHCDDEAAVQKYLSAEYDLIEFDELATFEKDMVLEIMARARSRKKGVKALVRAGSNPGALWIADRFIYRQVPYEEDPYYDPNDWAFIPAKLQDNPYLADPDGRFIGYGKRLGALAPWRRRQLLEGDWTALGGQFFSEFGQHHIAEIEIPDWCSAIRGIDWGYNKPGYCGWFYPLPDGRLYLRRELKFEQTIPSHVAKLIRKFSIVNRNGRLVEDRIKYTIGDPSMVKHETGESIAETFGRYGIHIIPGDNARVAGWQRVRAWLQNAPDGKPWFQVHPDCKYFIRSFSTLISDKHDPEDVDTGGDDHPGDTFRYVAMSRPAPPEKFTSGEPRSGTVGYDFARALKEARGSFVRRLGDESRRPHR